MNFFKLKTYVGNDIVDLKTSDALTFFQSEKYRKRVLREDELSSVLESKDPFIYFWIYWSIKEAAYKVAKKIDPTIVFSHKLFKVNILSMNENEGTSLVAFNQFNHFVKFEFNEDLVYSTCFPISNQQELISCFELNTKISYEEFTFNEEEKKSIHSIESLLVRCLAKKYFRDKGLPEFKIIRKEHYKKFLPPEIYDGSNKNEMIDISMSHDGRYCAVSIFYRS